MKQSTQFAAALLVAAVAAQQQYTIDPNSVANATRQAWCVSQITQCPLICLQTDGNTATTPANTCTWQTLTYSCVCSNGLSPNVSEYSQTIPYYICTEWGNQCVSNCGGNSACQSDCRQKHPCGAQNPTRQNTSTLSSTMSSTATGTKGSNSAAATTDAAGGTVYSGFAGAAATSVTPKTGAAASMIRGAALRAGKTFGSLAVVSVVIGGFAVLL